MNREQFATALKDLHAPLQPVQQERPALTQHDIEYSQAAFATVEQMFKQMGV